MATAKNKAAEADYSMEEKIMALYELQQIDSKIDEINKVKGARSKHEKRTAGSA